MDPSDDFPSSTPAPTFQTTVAAPTAQDVAKAMRAEAIKAKEDSLDIKDPSEPDPDAPAPKTDAEQPKAKEKGPVEGATVEPKFSAALLSRAATHGITAAEAQAYGDPAHLERTLGLLDRQGAQRSFEQPVQTPQVQPEPEPELTFPDLPPLAEGQEWDPAMQAWVQSAQQAFSQVVDQNKQLATQFTQTQTQAQQKAIAEEARFVDGKFNALEGDLAVKFGKGTAKTLHPSSPQYQERRAVATMAQNLMNQLGLDREEAFERSMRAIHPEYTTTKQQETTGEQLRDHQGRFLAEPTARKPGEGTTLDRDTPPQDPKARIEWARQRFMKRAEVNGLGRD